MSTLMELAKAKNRDEVIAILLDKAKLWYAHPSTRAKANHARMPQAELDLYMSIRKLIEIDTTKV